MFGAVHAVLSVRTQERSVLDPQVAARLSLTLKLYREFTH